MSMEVKGLDSVIRQFGDHKNIIESELKKAEREGADLIRDEAKRLAPGIGKVANSVHAEVASTDGLIWRIGSYAKTVYSIEKGRPSSVNGRNLWPSIEKIEGWILHYGVGAAQTIKGHRYVRPRKRSAAAAALHDEAAKVIYAMKQRGSTNPLPFIEPAWRNASHNVEVLFQDAVHEALTRLTR